MRTKPDALPFASGIVLILIPSIPGSTDLRMMSSAAEETAGPVWYGARSRTTSGASDPLPDAFSPITITPPVALANPQAAFAIIPRAASKRVGHSLQSKSASSGSPIRVISARTEVILPKKRSAFVGIGPRIALRGERIIGVDRRKATAGPSTALGMTGTCGEGVVLRG